jgi:hypothetical protein
MSENELNEGDSSDDDFKFDSNKLEEVILVKESYCMACDSPLKSYSSLICHDCLGDSVDVLSRMIETSDDEKKTIFVDPSYYNKHLEDIEEEMEDEVFEDEISEDEISNEDVEASFDYRMRRTLKNLLCEMDDSEES